MAYNDIYIVDSDTLDRSVQKYLNEWCPISRQMDIAKLIQKRLRLMQNQMIYYTMYLKIMMQALMEMDCIPADNIDLSWDEIFKITVPIMIDESDEGTVKRVLENFISHLNIGKSKMDKTLFDKILKNYYIDYNDFQGIKIQLRALGLITKSVKTRSIKDTSTYWTLTLYGDNVMTRLIAIKKNINFVMTKLSHGARE
jgi:hypothetical protein